MPYFYSPQIDDALRELVGGTGETMDEIFGNKPKPDTSGIMRKPYSGPTDPEELNRMYENRPRQETPEEYQDRADAEDSGIQGVPLQKGPLVDRTDVENMSEQEKMVRDILSSRKGGGVPLPLPRMPDVDLQTMDQLDEPLGEFKRSDVMRRLEGTDEVEAEYERMKPNIGRGHGLSAKELIDQVLRSRYITWDGADTGEPSERDKAIYERAKEMGDQGVMDEFEETFREETPEERAQREEAGRQFDEQQKRFREHPEELERAKRERDYMEEMLKLPGTLQELRRRQQGR